MSNLVHSESVRKRFWKYVLRRQDHQCWPWMETPKSDMICHPPHYKQGDIECIQAIKAALGSEGFKAYCKGQVFKYLWRAEHKGNAVEDLGKADWYMRRLLLEAEA